jgi:hypothetical protein
MAGLTKNGLRIREAVDDPPLVLMEDAAIKRPCEHMLSVAGTAT